MRRAQDNFHVPTPRILRAVGILCCVVLAWAGLQTATAQERGNDEIRRSKNGVAEGELGGIETRITYGRPAARGRQLWGKLVPFGEVWRAGADEATTITFAEPATLGGQEVPAGTYALFVLPDEASWMFIINAVANQWGAFAYDESQDLARIRAKVEEANQFAEQLTFTIENDRVRLQWGSATASFALDD